MYVLIIRTPRQLASTQMAHISEVYQRRRDVEEERKNGLKIV